MLSSGKRKKQKNNNAVINISAPNYTTLLAAPTHVLLTTSADSQRQTCTLGLGEVLTSLSTSGQIENLHVLLFAQLKPPARTRRRWSPECTPARSARGRSRTPPATSIHPSYNHPSNRAQHTIEQPTYIVLEVRWVFHLRRSRSEGRRRPAGGRWRGAPPGTSPTPLPLFLSLTMRLLSLESGLWRRNRLETARLARGGTRPYVYISKRTLEIEGRFQKIFRKGVATALIRDRGCTCPRRWFFRAGLWHPSVASFWWVLQSVIGVSVCLAGCLLIRIVTGVCSAFALPT